MGRVTLYEMKVYYNVYNYVCMVCKFKCVYIYLSAAIQIMKMN